MAEQAPENEFDEAKALAAARRAVDDAFAEGVRGQVEDAFPPEAHAAAAVEDAFTPETIADAAYGAAEDVAERIREAGQTPYHDPYDVMSQGAPQNASFNPDGIMSARIGDGGVAEHLQNMPPASPEDFAAMSAGYKQQFPPPVGPASSGPGQMYQGRPDSLRSL